MKTYGLIKTSVLLFIFSLIFSPVSFSESASNPPENTYSIKGALDLMEGDTLSIEVSNPDGAVEFVSSNLSGIESSHPGNDLTKILIKSSEVKKMDEAGYITIVLKTADGTLKREIPITVLPKTSSQTDKTSSDSNQDTNIINSVASENESDHQYESFNENAKSDSHLSKSVKNPLSGAANLVVGSVVNQPNFLNSSTPVSSKSAVKNQPLVASANPVISKNSGTAFKAPGDNRVAHSAIPTNNAIQLVTTPGQGSGDIGENVPNLVFNPTEYSHPMPLANAMETSWDNANLLIFRSRTPVFSSSLFGASDQVILEPQSSEPTFSFPSYGHYEPEDNNQARNDSTLYENYIQTATFPLVFGNTDNSRKMQATLCDPRRPVNDNVYECGSCGDGYKQSTEGCDDGNIIDGDGCSSTCTVEAGATCTGEGINHECALYCGDTDSDSACGLSCSRSMCQPQNIHSMLEVHDAPIVIDPIPSASNVTKEVKISFTGNSPVEGFSYTVSSSSGHFSVKSTTCYAPISQDCSITINYLADEIGTQTATLSIFYFDGTQNQQKDYPIQGTSTPNDTRHVLVVYDSNNADSVEVKDYYLENRPGMNSVNVLGVTLPQDNQNLAKGQISLADFNNFVQTPILNWIQTHPDKTIYYITLVYPFPNRIVDADKSIATRLETTLMDTGNMPNTSVRYKAPNAWCLNNTTLCLDRSINYAPFAQDRINYPGSMALITYLHMGSKEATKAYIDKLQLVYSKMQHPNVIISGEDANVTGTTYYSEDVGCDGKCEEGYAKIGFAQLFDLHVGPNQSWGRTDYPINSDTHFTSIADVKAYFSWGANGGLGTNYATDGSVVFSGKSSWYLIKTAESNNGVYDPHGEKGFSGWFSRHAFGGTNYENTPIGAVADTGSLYNANFGVNTSSYTVFWQQGFMFADAAWLSRDSENFIAIGDPLVKK